MKLIDLLVKELPKRGGWPSDHRLLSAIQDFDREVKFNIAGFVLEFERNKKGIWGSDRSDAWLIDYKFTPSKLAIDYATAIITRDQYEAALAASKEPLKFSGDFSWSHTGSGGDIIAYRLHKPDAKSRANDNQLEQDLNECTGQDVDVVNHPSHYTKGSIECIDAIDSATTGKSGIEAVCVANVIKYLWRYEEKNGLEDVKKAKWYLNKLISELESK